MKKLLTILTLLLFTFTLTGCKEQKSEFEQAMMNMETMDNVTMEMVIEMPIFGSVTSTIKIDDTMMVIDVLGETEYFLRMGDYMYTIEVIDFNEYGAIYSPQEDAGDVTGLPDTDAFSEDDFELEEGFYVYQGSVEELEGLKMKIEEHYITQMVFEVEEEGLLITMTIDFTDYGTTTISGKPQVPHFDEYAMILVELYEAGYSVMYEGTQLYVYELNGTFSTAYEFGTTHSVGGLELNPIDNTVWTFDGENEDFFSFDEYYNGLVTPSVDRETLELLDQLFEIWAN